MNQNTVCKISAILLRHKRVNSLDCHLYPGSHLISTLKDQNVDDLMVHDDVLSWERFPRYWSFVGGALQWRHNGRDGVSNHQPHDCWLNRLFGRRSKKTSKLRVTGLCVGNSPVTGEFPTQRASNAENVSIWWRHHVLLIFHIATLPFEMHSHHECVVYTFHCDILRDGCYFLSTQSLIIRACYMFPRINVSLCPSRNSNRYGLVTTLWKHRSGPTKIMACCLMATRRYSNQCWQWGLVAFTCGQFHRNDIYPCFSI